VEGGAEEEGRGGEGEVTFLLLCCSFILSTMASTWNCSLCNTFTVMYIKKLNR
jgi:hypothetical protein